MTRNLFEELKEGIEEVNSSKLILKSMKVINNTSNKEIKSYTNEEERE